MAERILSREEEFIAAGKEGTLSTFEAWATEHFARLYNITGDKRYLDFCVELGSYINKIEFSHSHSFMCTMRGLQLAAIYSGDKTLNDKPEFFRKKIANEYYEMADGGIGEVFPRGYRNEGCSVADWLMMNLNSALISGDNETYRKAENILYAVYIPTFLPSGKCDIVCKEKDENGFLKFETEPIPEWSYFEEGPFSRTCVKNAAVNVKVRFENGREETLRFTPLCYNISNLSCYDVPIIFNSLID